MTAFKLLLSFCLFILGTHAQAQPQRPIGCNPAPGANTCSWLTTQDSIYPLPSTLPLFSLEDQVTFPEDVLGDILQSADPGANITQNQVDGN